MNTSTLLTHLSYLSDEKIEHLVKDGMPVHATMLDLLDYNPFETEKEDDNDIILHELYLSAYYAWSVSEAESENSLTWDNFKEDINESDLTAGGLSDLSAKEIMRAKSEVMKHMSRGPTSRGRPTIGHEKERLRAVRLMIVAVTWYIAMEILPTRIQALQVQIRQMTIGSDAMVA